MHDTLTLLDITGAYGIKGWVKVRLRLDNPKTLTSFNNLLLFQCADSKPQFLGQVHLIELQKNGTGFIARLKGVEDRSAAELLKGCEIRVKASDFPQAGQGEYYWRDLIGLHVWCHELEKVVLLGAVDRLIETGANDVLVVIPCPGSADDKEHLVPWIPEEVIIDVDLVEKIIRVNWYADI